VVDWDRIGKDEHPAQNPPPIEENDRFTWNFYLSNATEFVKEFGIMPKLLSELNLADNERYLFLRKLSLIHETMIKIRNRQFEEEMKRMK